MTAAVSCILGHLLMTPPVPVVVVARPVAGRVYAVTGHADHAHATTLRRRTEGSLSGSGLLGHGARACVFALCPLFPVGSGLSGSSRPGGAVGLARLTSCPLSTLVEEAEVQIQIPIFEKRRNFRTVSKHHSGQGHCVSCIRGFDQISNSLNS